MLARNKKAKSYPSLKGKMAEITIAYLRYLNSSGDATKLTPLGLEEALSDHLVEHYRKPPKSHSHIKSLRDVMAAHTCAMCGSLSCGTLDHILPKEHFPEFSLYSKNLVPACLCNSKRGSEFKSNDGARVLHPYFDTILSERLVGCEFEDHGPAPSLRIVNLLPQEHSQFRSVQFHIEKVLLKTAIKAAIRRNWANLMLRPGLAIRALSARPHSLGDLNQKLLEEQLLLDEAHQSRNNWHSIFVSGLLVPKTTKWLYDALTYPGRLSNDPLVGGR